MREAQTGKTRLKVVTRPGTSVLWLRGTVRGRSIFESTGTNDPGLAEEARATREAELYRGALHGEAPKRVSFAQATAAYLTRPGGVSTHTKIAIGRIVRHLGPKITCDAIDQTVIDTAVKALCRPDVKPATVLRAITTPIRSVLSYAAERGWCPPPRFKKGRAGGTRTDWFTPEEAEALIDAAAAHIQPLLEFLFGTGCRLGEAVALMWDDVDLRYARAVIRGEVIREDGSLRRGTKNGDDRILDLPPRVVAALGNLTGERAGRVFLCPVGNPQWKGVKWVPYRLSGDNKFGSGGGQIKKAWATALRGAGITRHLTPHHTRHSWASWHYCVYKDLLRLRQDGGWRTSLQCERYAKLVPNGMKPEIERFWAATSDIRTISVQSA